MTIIRIVFGSLGLAVEFELVHSCQVRGELDRSDLLWDTVDPDGPLWTRGES